MTGKSRAEHTDGEFCVNENGERARIYAQWTKKSRNGVFAELTVDYYTETEIEEINARREHILMDHYQVFREDGTEVRAGDQITSFRGEIWEYTGCTHPRKVTVRSLNPIERNGGSFCSHRDFYPNVFDLRIEVGE